ncbi:MAG: hypothetical protein BGP10_15975 [Rhodanobacter sp. 68-29]|nr:hypothetical protein [Rhodanobacter sp.]ODV27894.1 MAG: hypothetical protein ABT19_01555 [Rhodanobacter sp. SCN 68-63]OJY61403.1 MAG: hypothetical protein BGP10_15975 [Rhodanobacter sp. 68-29]
MIGIAPIVDQVATWLRTIRTANGYATDLGAHIVTETVGLNGDDAILIAGVFVSGLNLDKGTPQRRDWDLDLQCEARVPIKQATAEATAVAVLEDILRAIPTRPNTAPDTLKTLDATGGSVTRQPDGVPYIVVSVTLRATCYDYTSKPA